MSWYWTVNVVSHNFFSRYNLISIQALQASYITSHHVVLLDQLKQDQTNHSLFHGAQAAHRAQIERETRRSNSVTIEDRARHPRTCDTSVATLTPVKRTGAKADLVARLDHHLQKQTKHKPSTSIMPDLRTSSISCSRADRGRALREHHKLLVSE